MNAYATATRLIVRVAQDVVRAEAFTTYADLVEAIKTRCAQLRIPYDSALVWDAVDRLERGGAAPVIARPPRLVERQDTGPAPVSKQEAADVVARLFARVPAATLRTIDQPTDPEAHEKRVRAQADAMRGQRPRPRRRPVMDRLREIFSEGGERREDA